MSKRYVDADTGKPHSFVTTRRPNVLRTNTWANSVYALLRKEQPKWTGFSFMPKGEVQ